MLSSYLQNKKDQRLKKAMVLLLISDSREISFRPDDCLSHKSWAATPHRSNLIIPDLSCDVYVHHIIVAAIFHANKCNPEMNSAISVEVLQSIGE